MSLHSSMKYKVFRLVKNCYTCSSEKERNFIKNGAVLMEMHISSFDGKCKEPIKIYSAKDIDRATNSYDLATIVLVHELMDGSLFDFLHEPNRCWLSWQNHQRIATEVAYALSYMHTAGPKPIVHRDVKSSSIFLDKSLSAKLSSFRLSITINPEDMTQTWPIIGIQSIERPAWSQRNVMFIVLGLLWWNC
ncbi:Wall-associated receptor kinase 2 [Bienertia sinuspersici]